MARLRQGAADRAPHVVCIGECMLEVAPQGDGLYRLGHAGDTFNAAWYLRRLLPEGARIGYATRIGCDGPSERMAAFMREAGIDTAPVQRDPSRGVGLYLIELIEGERRFAYWRGHSAARHLADDPDRLSADLAGADLILLSGITLAIVGAAGRERLHAALRRARAAGASVALDTNMRPALWSGADEMRDAITEAARSADIVLPSLDDERGAFGDADAAAVIARYRSHGAGCVAVKDGASPVIWWSEATGHGQTAPVPVADLVDSTAAGDSFAAGLLSVLATGGPLDTAVRLGAATAAEVVQGRGALVGIDVAALRAAAGA